MSALLLLILFNLGKASAGEGHHHHHAPPKNVDVTKGPAGKKFESDAPLRAHMADIRAAVDGMRNRANKGEMSEAEYAAVAEKIDKSVQLIFKDCRLMPAADAALHQILSEIIAGAGAMKSGPDKKARESALLRTVNALSKYGETFNDPKWSVQSRGSPAK